MKKYLSAIAALAFVTVFFYNDQLNITGRMADGTLENDVRKSQTYYGITNENAVKANMQSLRKFVECVENPETCKSRATRIRN